MTTDPDDLLVALRQALHDVANHLNTVSMQAEVGKMLAQQGKAVEKPLERIVQACRDAGELTRAAELAAGPDRNAESLNRLQSIVKSKPTDR